ncbi:DUF515 domain-containing protein [Methanopyrus kandleri]|uniref:DUF515 domain-containing protein n=1 Tax=Methanopyrus kandleri TaxID=2320 RepID=A0A832WPK7_9EURY|nr:DUF515 domain-containing protein [Methanopyrus kandleri]HII70699.1 DUF515 domain-containing protein [Methanopyrus kandleri]
MLPRPPVRPTNFVEIPEERRHAVIGAIVIGLIFLAAGGGAYYFFVYKPYVEQLEKLRAQKLKELNTYFTGPLAASPTRTKLQQQILSAETPEQLQAIDVVGAATVEWRRYLAKQIKMNQKKGRVELVTPEGPQLLTVRDALNKIRMMGVDELMKVQVKRPETVLIAIWADPNKTGPIKVGDRVTLSITNWALKKIAKVKNKEAYKGPNQISGAIVRYIMLIKGGLPDNFKIDLVSASALETMYRTGSSDLALRKVVFPAGLVTGRSYAVGGGTGVTYTLKNYPGLNTRVTSPHLSPVALVDLRDLVKAMAVERARRGGGFIRQLMSIEAREGIRSWENLLVIVEIPKDAVQPKVLIASSVKGGIWILPET